MEPPMTTLAATSGAAPRRGSPLASNLLVAMMLFIFVEVMLFAGLISAFVIIKSGVNPVLWPPPDQPRLPIWSTAINTAALLGSGAVLRAARRRFKASPESAKGLLAGAIGLGAFFLVFQGAEWVRLLGQGLTMTSSHLGAFFYLIVGCHALHAIVALAFLLVANARLRAGRLRSDFLDASSAFWAFVVLVWPLLYGIVYLG